MAKKRGLAPPISYPIDYRPNPSQPWKMEWQPKSVTVKVFKQTDAGKQYISINIVTRTQVLTPETNLYKFAQASLFGDAAVIDVGVDPNFAKQLTYPKTKSTFLIEVRAFPFGGLVAGMMGANLPAGVGMAMGGGKKQRIVQVKDQAQLEPEFPHPYIWVPNIDTGGIQKVTLDSSKKAWNNVDVQVRRYSPPTDKFEKTGDQLEWKAGGANSDLVEFEQASGNTIKVKASRLVVSQAGAVFPASITVTAPKTPKPGPANPSVDIPVEVTGRPVRLNVSLQLADGTLVSKLENVTVTCEQFTVKVTGGRKDVPAKVAWEPVAGQAEYDAEQAAKLTLSGSAAVDESGEVKVTLSPRPLTSGQTMTLRMPALSCSVTKRCWQPVQYAFGPTIYTTVVKAIAGGSPTFKIVVKGAYESPLKLYKVEAPLLNVHAVVLRDGAAIGSLADTGTEIVLPEPTRPIPAEVEPIDHCEQAVQRVTSYSGQHFPMDGKPIQNQFERFAKAYLESLLNSTEEDLIKTQPGRLKLGGQVSTTLQGVRMVMVEYDSAVTLYISAMDEFMDALFSFSVDLVLAAMEKVVDLLKWVKDKMRTYAPGAAGALDSAGAAVSAALKPIADALEALKKKAKELTEALEEWRKRQAWLNQMCAALKKEIDDLIGTQIPTFKRAYDALKEPFEKATKELAETEKNLKELEPKYTKALKEVNDAKEPIKKLTDECTQLGTSRAARQADVDALRAARKLEGETAEALAKLEQEFAEKSGKATEALEELKALRKTEEGLVETAGKKSDAVKALDSEVSEATGKMGACDQRITTLNADKATKTGRLTTLNEEIGRQETRLAQVDVDLPAKRTGLTTVENELKTVSDDLAGLPGKVTQAQTRLTRLSEEIAEVRGQLAAGVENPAQLQRRLLSLEGRETAVKQEIAGYQAQQTTLKGRSDALGARETSLKAEIGSLETEKATLGQEIATNKGTAGTLKTEVDEIDTDLGLQRQERTGWETKRDEANGKLPDARTQAEDATNSAREAGVKTGEAQTKHEGLAGDAKAVEDKLDPARTADTTAKEKRTQAETSYGEQERLFEQEGQRIKDAQDEVKRLEPDLVAKEEAFLKLEEKNNQLELLQTQQKQVLEPLTEPHNKAKADYENAQRSLTDKQTQLANDVEKEIEKAQEGIAEVTGELAENGAAQLAKQEELRRARLEEAASGGQGYGQQAEKLAQEMEQKSQTWTGMLTQFVSYLGSLLSRFWTWLKKLFSWSAANALWEVLEKLWGILEWCLGCLLWACGKWMQCLRWLVGYADGHLTGLFSQMKQAMAAAGIEYSTPPADLEKMLNSTAKAKLENPGAVGKAAAAIAKTEGSAEEKALLAGVGKMFFDNIVWSFDTATSKFISLHNSENVPVADPAATSKSISDVNKKLAYFMDRQRVSRNDAEAFHGLDALGLNFNWPNIQMWLSWIQFVAA